MESEFGDNRHPLRAPEDEARTRGSQLAAVHCAEGEAVPVSNGASHWWRCVVFASDQDIAPSRPKRLRKLGPSQTTTIPALPESCWIVADCEGGRVFSMFFHWSLGFLRKCFHVFFEFLKRFRCSFYGAKKCLGVPSLFVCVCRCFECFLLVLVFF